MLPTSQAFFQVFFGVLLSGAQPVPIYPPFRLDRILEYAMREVKILNNAEVRALVTFAMAEKLSHLLKVHVPSLKFVATADKLFSKNSSLPDISRKSDQAALLQYTSGSTGDPKGIFCSIKIF